MRAAKKLLNETRQGDLAAGFALETKLQTGLIGSPNQVEAINAYFEKRDPEFTNPD